MEDGKFRGLSSELTLLELTVRPLQIGRQDVADNYEVLLAYLPCFDLEPVSSAVLLEAARLRARWRLRAPDAIQVATGLTLGATLAVTNNEAWAKSTQHSHSDDLRLGQAALLVAFDHCSSCEASWRSWTYQQRTVPQARPAAPRHGAGNLFYVSMTRRCVMISRYAFQYAATRSSS